MGAVAILAGRRGIIAIFQCDAMDARPETVRLFLVTSGALDRLGGLGIIRVGFRQILVALRTLPLAMHRCLQLGLVHEQGCRLSIRQIFG